MKEKCERESVNQCLLVKPREQSGNMCVRALTVTLSYKRKVEK